MKQFINSIFLIVLIAFSNNLKAEEALLWQDCVKEVNENHPDLISAEEKSTTTDLVGGLF